MAIPQRVWTDKKVVRAKGDDKLRSQVYLKDGELQYQDAKGHWIVAGGDVPPLNNVIERTSETTVDVLTDGDGNYVNITMETDPETGDTKVVVIPYGIFEDERYIEDDINLWQEMFESMDSGQVELVFEYATEFPSDVFAALDSFYKNPTEANYETAHEVLTSWIPEPEEPEEPLN